MSTSAREIVSDLFTICVVVFGLWYSREDGFRDGKKAVMDNLIRERLAKNTMRRKWPFTAPPVPAQRRCAGKSAS